MREWQSQAHVKHYCKYHVVFVPKYRKKSIYGTLRKDIGGILRVVPPAWGGIGGGIRDERPYPHVVDDSAEVQCGEYDRFFEREVCDSDIQGLFAGEKELHRASFLRQRVLREHRWLGRADDS